MLAGGVLWAGALLADAAGGQFPPLVFAAAVVLVGLSLPWAVVPGTRAARGSRVAAVAGVVAVLSGLAAVLLFNLQVVLLLADQAGVGVSDRGMDTGRRSAAWLLATGLLALAASRRRVAGAGAVAALLGGVAGVAAAILYPHGLFFTWYLGLALVWLLLGAEARQPRSLPAP